MTPEEQQEAVRLRVEERLTYSEIAKRFNVSVSTITKILERFGATGRVNRYKSTPKIRFHNKPESERTAEERLELTTLTSWPIERRESAMKYAERYLREPERQRMIEVIEVRGRQHDAKMREVEDNLDWNE